MSNIVLPNGGHTDEHRITIPEANEAVQAPRPGPWLLKIIFDPVRQAVTYEMDSAQFKTWSMVIAILKMAERKAECLLVDPESAIPSSDAVWRLDVLYDPETQTVDFRIYAGQFKNAEMIIAILELAKIGADDNRRMGLARAIQEHQQEQIQLEMAKQQIAAKGINPMRGRGHR